MKKHNFVKYAARETNQATLIFTFWHVHFFVVTPLHVIKICLKQQHNLKKHGNAPAKRNLKA